MIFNPVDKMLNVKEMQNNDENPSVMLGYIKAYQSQFHEAAHFFQKGNQEQKALEMFTELRMFDQAEVIYDECDNKLIKLAFLHRSSHCTEGQWLHVL